MKLIKLKANQHMASTKDEWQVREGHEKQRGSLANGANIRDRRDISKTKASHIQGFDVFVGL